MKKENPNVRAHERRHVNHQHSRVFSHFFVAKSRLRRYCSQDGRAHFLVRRNRLQMRAASHRAACVLRTSSTRDDVAGKTESVHLQTKLYASWCKIVKIPHQSTHRKKSCLGLPSNKGCQRLLETLSAPRNPSIVDANLCFEDVASTKVTESASRCSSFKPSTSALELCSRHAQRAEAYKAATHN